MKVETPQLRWHQIVNPTSAKDACHNAPILSCSLHTLPADETNAGARSSSGAVRGACASSTAGSKVGVLATAGNSEVNLWRVRFTDDSARVTSGPGRRGADPVDVDGDGGGAPSAPPSSNDGASSHILVQPAKSADPAHATPEHTRIVHLATLSRGSGGCTVNAVSFSPDGSHLVAAGDNGTLVVYSSPPSGWDAVASEKDVPMQICRNSTEDVMDVSFSSSDPARFVAGSIDKTFAAWELRDGEWRCAASQKDHVNYVQGVAYDPQGVYLASMGSDRTVRVYSRRAVKGSVLREEAEKYQVVRDGANGGGEKEGEDDEEMTAADRNEIIQRRVVPDQLAASKFDLQKQVRTIKFLEGTKQPSTSSSDGNEEGDGEGNSEGGTPAKQDGQSSRRHNLFADEITLGSFFRRLSFTADGAFLVVPAGQWHGTPSDPSAASPSAPGAGAPRSPTGVDERLAEGSFATYLFARHQYETPHKVLAGLEKPSVCVRPNPVLFELPDAEEGSGGAEGGSSCGLPHRSVFAVLTSDSVLVYDTYHPAPLAVASGLHCTGLTDAAWSDDGRTLFVTSTDGYVSVLSFADGELGRVYDRPAVRIVRRDGAEEGRGEKSAGAGEAAQPAAMVVRKKPKVPQQSASSSADGGDVRPVNTLVAKRKPAAPSPTDDVSKSSTVNTLVAKKKPKKPSQPAASDESAAPEPAEHSAKKVQFSPFAEVKEIEAVERRTPAVNDLTAVARKKKKGGNVGGVASECGGRTPPNSPAQGNPVGTTEADPAEVAACVAKTLERGDESAGEKRSFEPGVTVLLPKKKNKNKKMKVASGSAPVASG